MKTSDLQYSVYIAEYLSKLTPIMCISFPQTAGGVVFPTRVPSVWCPLLDPVQMKEYHFYIVNTGFSRMVLYGGGHYRLTPAI